MENVTEQEKSTIGKKLLEFQKMGLVSYGKYLTEQLDFASKSALRSAYKKYIEDQILMNEKKIEEINSKL